MSLAHTIEQLMLTHAQVVDHILILGTLLIIILNIAYIAYEDYKKREFYLEQLAPAALATITYVFITNSFSTASHNFKIALIFAIILPLLGAWALGDSILLLLMAFTVNPLKLIMNLFVALLGYYIFEFPYEAKRRGKLREFLKDLSKTYLTSVLNITVAVAVSYFVTAPIIRHLPKTTPVLIIYILQFAVIFLAFKALSKLPSKLRTPTALIIGGILAIAIAHQPNSNQVALSLIKVILFLAILYLPYRMYRLAGDWVFKEKKPINEVTPGEILGEVIYQEGDIIKRLPLKGLSSFVQVMKLKTLHQQGKIKILADNTAEGITEEQLKKLKELADEGKLEPYLLITKSAPFVPILLVAYIATLIYPNAGWTIMTWIKSLVSAL